MRQRGNTTRRGTIEQQGDEINRLCQALSARKMELQEALSVELTKSSIESLLQFRETVAAGLEIRTLKTGVAGWRYYNSQEL